MLSEPLAALDKDLAQGNQLFVLRDFEASTKHFKDALLKDPKNINALLGLVIALHRLQRWEEVIEASDRILALDSEAHIVHYYKGRGLYELGQIRAAHDSLCKGLEAETLGHLTCNTPNISHKVQRLLALCKEKLDNDNDNHSEVDTTATPHVLKAKSRNIRHEWTQSESTIFVTLYAKRMLDDCWKLLRNENGGKTATNKFGIVLQSVGEEPYEFVVDELFDEIEPEATRVVVTSMKVEVKLKKHRPGVSWSALQRPKQSLDRTVVESTCSTKMRQSRWDAACAADLNDEVEGEEALNKLFREIYAKGDENTRRAMVKSFQTSGGTVLSTNWKDVEHEDYEKSIEPPKGLEVRRWAE